MRLIAALAVLGAGCFSKPEFRPGGGDGGYPTSFGPFMQVQALTDIAATGPSLSDTAPTVSSNPLELFFTSDRADAAMPPRIYVAKRRRPDEMFSKPQPFYFQSTGESDGTINSAGTVLFYLDSTRGLHAAERASIADGWSPSGASLPSRGPADLGAEDLRLMAGSTADRAAPGSSLVEFSRATTNEGWRSAPAPTFPPGASGDTAPTLSRDGLELFYEHHSTAAHWEIYRAERASLDVPFSSSAPLVDVSSAVSADTIGHPELSYDGLTLYFCVRESGGGFRIYAATREPM